MPDLLPDCRAKVVRGRIYRAGQSWIPVFCPHCGAEGPMIPENNREFAFYQCEPCADKFPTPDGMVRVPDDVWNERIQHAQQEDYGRVLTVFEQVIELSDVNSKLSKLARDRPQYGKG